MISLKRRILAIFNTLEMCTCVYISIYEYIYTHTYIYSYRCTHTHTHTPMYEWAQWCVSELSHVRLFVTPGSTVHGLLQARILKWVAPLQGVPPDPGIELVSLASPALAGRFFITDPPGKPTCIHIYIYSFMFVCSYILRNNSHSH